MLNYFRIAGISHLQERENLQDGAAASAQGHALLYVHKLSSA